MFLTFSSCTAIKFTSFTIKLPFCKYLHCLGPTVVLEMQMKYDLEFFSDIHLTALEHVNHVQINTNNTYNVHIKICTK